MATIASGVRATDDDSTDIPLRSLEQAARMIGVRGDFLRCLPFGKAVFDNAKDETVNESSVQGLFPFRLFVGTVYDFNGQMARPMLVWARFWSYSSYTQIRYMGYDEDGGQHSAFTEEFSPEYIDKPADAFGHISGNATRAVVLYYFLRRGAPFPLDRINAQQGNAIMDACTQYKQSSEAQDKPLFVRSDSESSDTEGEVIDNAKTSGVPPKVPRPTQPSRGSRANVSSAAKLIGKIVNSGPKRYRGTPTPVGNDVISTSRPSTAAPIRPNSTSRPSTTAPIRPNSTSRPSTTAPTLPTSRGADARLKQIDKRLGIVQARIVEYEKREQTLKDEDKMTLGEHLKLRGDLEALEEAIKLKRAQLEEVDARLKAQDAAILNIGYNIAVDRREKDRLEWEMGRILRSDSRRLAGGGGR
ncbi:hypothetical protein K505DRAFT_367126 [Melanomma pulvis-pyrius CBS 109.77]|uniref:Uncharacterized protein n=1 Tax=Melanomma pulvis-pyrius CBS 109.77 TaxID=1314802 RepID=A0A6A6WVD1_9PLEO|nr:hypothetical protein K505DRAFT_367126 [Melanomma pulvis-pyrius CBS 109.77]